MRLAVKFAIVCTLAFIGACFHLVKPKRRELNDEHFI